MVGIPNRSAKLFSSVLWVAISLLFLSGCTQGLMGHNEVPSRVPTAISVDDETRLTSDPAEEYAPAWSPDGKHIAFVSERNGHRDIWLMDHDGKNERRIAKGALGAHELKYNVDKQVFDGLSFLYLSWSPDGRDLAFTRVNEEGRGEIAVMQVAQLMK